MTLEQASDYALAEPTMLSGTSPVSSQPVSPSRAAQQEFGGLTAREREIAAFIAQGKSNRSIAEELVVGVKTVEAHITRILHKLGLSSRSQIAVWAISEGLVPAPRDLGTQIRGS